MKGYLTLHLPSNTLSPYILSPSPILILSYSLLFLFVLVHVSFRSSTPPVLAFPLSLTPPFPWLFPSRCLRILLSIPLLSPRFLSFRVPHPFMISFTFPSLITITKVPPFPTLLCTFPPSVRASLHPFNGNLLLVLAGTFPLCILPYITFIYTFFNPLFLFLSIPPFILPFFSLLFLPVIPSPFPTIRLICATPLRDRSKHVTFQDIPFSPSSVLQSHIPITFYI